MKAVVSYFCLNSLIQKEIVISNIYCVPRVGDSIKFATSDYKDRSSILTASGRVSEVGYTNDNLLFIKLE